MTDANTICHDVDLLGDWLDSRGYTEEAGLCLRVLGLIHEQAEENEKLRAASKRMLLEFDFMVESGVIPDVRNDVIFESAAAALKETGDE